eukprot:6453990-Prymnesium_polylepis.2
MALEALIARPPLAGSPRRFGVPSRLTQQPRVESRHQFARSVIVDLPERGDDRERARREEGAGDPHHTIRMQLAPKRVALVQHHEPCA